MDGKGHRKQRGKQQKRRRGRTGEKVRKKKRKKKFCIEAIVLIAEGACWQKQRGQTSDSRFKIQDRLKVHFRYLSGHGKSYEFS